MNTQELDPRSLPLGELRRLRAELQHEDFMMQNQMLSSFYSHVSSEFRIFFRL